jgi:hypothetical protein
MAQESTARPYTAFTTLFIFVSNRTGISEIVIWDFECVRNGSSVIGNVMSKRKPGYKRLSKCDRTIRTTSRKRRNKPASLTRRNCTTQIWNLRPPPYTTPTAACRITQLQRTMSPSTNSGLKSLSLTRANGLTYRD